MKASTIYLLIASAMSESAFCIAAGGEQASGKQAVGNERLCCSTPQGLIPEVTKMVSTMITTPASDSKVNAAKGFKIDFTVTGLMAGQSKDLKTQFLLDSQSLDAKTGLIKGSAQISIQALSKDLKAPVAKTVSFFQALTTKSDAAGVTNFKVDIKPNEIKTKGPHRICTVSRSAGGQPVVMPVAQRGAQDDCIRIDVI